MTRANLTFNNVGKLPTTLVFDIPSSAIMWEKVQYLYAKSPDQTTPITFTSSNPAVLSIKLIDSYWRMEYCGPGTATVTASQSGQTSFVKSVTVSEKPAPMGRIINVGGNGGELSIGELSLLPGDTVVIAAGDYTGLWIENIIVPDGQSPITIITDGLVRLVNESSISFKNLRNVVVDGCRVPGIKQAILLDGHNYRGVYWNNLNHVEIWGVELRDVYDTAWYNDWSGMEWIYNGADINSYQKDIKIINCKSDNAGGFSTNGNVNAEETNKLIGLIVDLQVLGYEAVNTSAGSLFYIGAGQDVLFKDCIIDHVNCVNNNHNGVIFVRGQADLVNNRLTNFQGNLIRNWTFSVVDGHLGPAERTSKFYGNQIFCSRKYGAFEGQSFDSFISPGLLGFCNIEMFNNTTGNMNLNNNPVVFTGTLYDNYGLRGGRARLYNNTLINPVNGNSNNVYLTYNSEAIGGSEHQEGDIWEWNNRVYFSISESKVNPANLAPLIGNSGKTKAIDNETTVLFTEDLYGNPDVNNIGAVQSGAMPLPVIVSPPTIPDISAQKRNPWSTAEAISFMIDCKRSTSPIGIKNYDIERNGIVKTTRGAHCRDGKEDPSFNSDHLAWTAYTYRWRARDQRDQVSEWTLPMTFATEPGDGDTELNYATIPTITKISGGTLADANGVYTATGSAVLVNAGIKIPAGHSARLIINHEVGQGVFGWATTASITSLNDIKAAISTNDDGGRYEGVTDGIRIDQRDIASGALISLFISYNGDSWCERSEDGGRSWNKPGNLLTSAFFLGSNYTGDKYIVGQIPTDRSLSHPLVVLYPEPYNA